jgi:O-antigen/teichoic acid export membrane protein
VAADKWTNRILNFLVLLVLARLLDPTDFGTVALANVFVTLLGVVSGLGFDAYIVRTPVLGKKTISTALWISLGVALLEYGLLAAAAPFLAVAFHAPTLPAMLWVLGIALPLGAAESIPTAILRRELDMRPIAVRGVFSSAIGGIGAVILAFLGAGAWALVFQLVTTQLLGCVLLYALTRWRPKLVFSRADAKLMTRFGISVVGSQLINQLRDRGDELLIGGILGPQALGFWVIATRILRTSVDLFTSVVTTVTLSSFAKVGQDVERLTSAVRAAISASAIVVIPGLVALSVLSPVLIPFAFGSKWEPSVFPAQLLTLAGVVQAMQWIDANIWWTLGKAGTEFLLSTGISAAHLAIVALAAPHGLEVVAVAILCRTVFLSPIRVLFLKFRAGMSQRIYSNVWRIAICSGVMAAAMIGTSRLIDRLPAVPYLIVEVAVGGLVYLGMSLVLVRPLVLRVAKDVRLLRPGKPSTATE